MTCTLISVKCILNKINLVGFSPLNKKKGGGGGGWNSSVGSVLGSSSGVMQHRGLKPPLILQWRDFSLGVNMGSDFISKNSFG